MIKSAIYNLNPGIFLIEIVPDLCNEKWIARQCITTL